MQKITKFFTELWRAKKSCGVAIPSYSVFFFDALPGIPVIYYNFCEINGNIGATVSISGTKQSIDLGIKR